jgi:hypothetical protein
MNPAHERRARGNAAGDTVSGAAARFDLTCVWLEAARRARGAATIAGPKQPSR